MKVQGNRYINNPEMIKNKVEKKTTVPQNIISEDDVKISDSARKLVETARDKVSDFQAMHFSSINGEIKEIPAEYKCENLFKLDLKAASISGEQSAFEGCLENQSEVFGKWLDENASEYLTEDEMKDLKEKINTMTADMDSLNAKEGYRGTSYESVFLLSASEAGLRKVNEMYVQEQFQAGFSPRFCCAHLIVTGSVAAEDLEKKARARAGSIPFATLIGLNPLNIRKAGITMNIWIKFAEITNAK